MLSPPQMTRSCQTSGTLMGFTAASVTWPTVQCWTAASPSTLRDSPTTTSEQEAPTVSLSRPPPSPLCPATLLSSTTWASTWTVWWCRVDPAVWDRPSGPWQGARPQTSPRAAVRDTPTSPPAPPRGWTRWTTPSFDSDIFEARVGDTTDSQGFLHFFLSLPETGVFCDFGWRGEGRGVTLSLPTMR